MLGRGIVALEVESSGCMELEISIPFEGVRYW
jgi:hypothetical protein